MIKLIENTDYTYGETYRFYGWEYAGEIKPLTDCGVENIGQLYMALLRAWSAETCSVRFRPCWSPDNPTAGQCTITAAIVHRLFCGEIRGLPLNDGSGVHSFNVINGRIVDLACEQFGKNALPDFSVSVEVDAGRLLSGGDKQSRCDLLIDNLRKTGVRI